MLNLHMYLEPFPLVCLSNQASTPQYFNYRVSDLNTPQHLEPTPEMAQVTHALGLKVKESPFLGGVTGGCLEEAREILV